MKKIIISVGVLFTVIASAILVVFLLQKRATSLVIKSSDWRHNVNLGSYRVSNFKEERMNKTRLFFSVESASDFYNDFIKTNEGYKSDLDFDIQGYFAYGYLIYDDYVIKYSIKYNNIVELSEEVCSWLIFEDEYDAYFTKDVVSHHRNYCLIGPMECYLGYSRLIKAEDECGRYDILEEEFITYPMLLKLYSYMPSESFKIDGNSIYLKGYYYGSFYEKDGVAYFNDDDDTKYYTDIYLVKLCYEDGKVVVKNANQ